ncbi:MAG: hypothetical protein R8K22_09700 [Mariprofundaceae bacterium]
MHAITANELKIRGVVSLEEGLRDEPEALITVRGKEQYVVMKMEQYHYLREMELEAALLEAKRDVAGGQSVIENAEAHVQRVFGA